MRIAILRTLILSIISRYNDLHQCLFGARIMEINQPIHIVGMSTITTNEAAFKQNTIGKLWAEFQATPIQEKLANITSSSIFAVYSDYASDYHGQYKLTIGYAVSDAYNIPQGFTAATILPGKYKTFKCKSPAPEDIIATWKMIWQQIDTKVLQPNFIVMFEEYKDNEVTINIGYE